MGPSKGLKAPSSSDEANSAHSQSPSDELGHSSPSRINRFNEFLSQEMDSDDVVFQKALYCILTGFISAICFLAVNLWPTFQTGGFVQLSIAIARLFAGPEPRSEFQMSDKQAFTSLMSFLLGAMILGRLGDKIGPKRRGWVMFATFVQALLLMAGALTVHYSREPSVASSRFHPSWRTPLGFATLGFASASLGIHAIIAKRLNTQFGTSVVLTTIWVELVCDPKLFVLGPVKTRDHRILACAGLFIGGLCGSALAYKIGSAGAFAVAAGLRVISAVSWVLVEPKAKS